MQTLNRICVCKCRSCKKPRLQGRSSPLRAVREVDDTQTSQSGDPGDKDCSAFSSPILSTPKLRLHAGVAIRLEHVVSCSSCPSLVSLRHKEHVLHPAHTVQLQACCLGGKVALAIKVSGLENLCLLLTFTERGQKSRRGTFFLFFLFGRYQKM